MKDYLSLKKEVGSGSESQRYGSVDPYSFQYVTDPKHCLPVYSNKTMYYRYGT
jgi:hypothetical protein